MNARKLSEAEIAQRTLKARQRHLRIIDGKKNRPTDFFYRITNPGQLAKVGASYLEDFKNGIKSFAITSTNYKSAQQRTVLALASYFDHLFDMKILIISDGLGQGVFEEIMEERTVKPLQLAKGKNLPVNQFHHHFDLVDLGDLLRLTNEETPSYDFELAMEQLLAQYDLVLWDPPIIDTAKNHSKLYNHIMGHFESLTIIVSPSISKAKDLNEIRSYFTGMGVNVKGVLFDTPGEQKKPLGVAGG